MARVSELIKRELAAVIDRECHFPGQIVTLHHVETMPDLKNSNVWVGVLGPKNEDPMKVIDKLNQRRGYLQGQLYKRVRLRNSPQLYFKLDDSAERGVRVVNLLNDLPDAVVQPVEESEEPVKFVGRDGLDHRWEKDQLPVPPAKPAIAPSTKPDEES